jgi:hypothetical protein
VTLLAALHLAEELWQGTGGPRRRRTALASCSYSGRPTRCGPCVSEDALAKAGRISRPHACARGRATARRRAITGSRCPPPTGPIPLAYLRTLKLPASHAEKNLLQSGAHPPIGRRRPLVCSHVDTRPAAMKELRTWEDHEARRTPHFFFSL